MVIIRAIATAFGIGLDELLGEAPPPSGEEDRLRELRGVMRRFDHPTEAPVQADRLERDLGDLFRLRGDADLAAVTQRLPGLLQRVQDRAHGSGLPGDWAGVADVYSTVTGSPPGIAG
ncbi:hypothetical protein [Streptomyces sp. NPDC005805]|uniref:hypothetical protein n=1 Tax=Streptomyces sp. NPDC005805 TaxID=3157068 RepID=UPI003403749D